MKRVENEKLKMKNFEDERTKKIENRVKTKEY
jgi:hypothetical protein